MIFCGLEDGDLAMVYFDDDDDEEEDGL